MKTFLRILAFFIATCALPCHAQTQAAPIVKATLISENGSLVPGKPFRLGILLEAKDHWHTYWENPGDAGIPTTLSWTLPEGFSAGAISWPMPARIIEGPLVIYGYEGMAFIPITLNAPATLSAPSYTFKVKAEWLVCKDICIPESADLSLTLPAGSGNASSDQPRFTAHDAAQPAVLKSAGNYHTEDKNIILSLPLDNAAQYDISSALFLPRQQNIVNYAAPQHPTLANGQLQFALSRAGGTPEGALSGFITVHNNGAVKSFDVTVNPATAATKPVAKTSFKSPAKPVAVWFPFVLLLATAGGLILNLMPCVLPVLSLKCLAIVRKSASERTHAVRQSVAYTLGIMLSFAVFAGILIALQHAGQSVGWGYQMQSPAFVSFLIYLLFLVGLSLSGIFHLPIVLGNVSVSNESSAAGSFATGILATMVATPCTAPFMASAVGFALSLPAWQAMLVFEALGFGLALPFLLISLCPRLLAFLPRPGAWMETFKELLAFPMYASVIWLLWVLTLQTGASGMVLIASGMLAIVALIWIKTLFASENAYRLMAIFAFIFLLAFTLNSVSKMELPPERMPTTASEYGVEAIPFSQARLDELRANGTPVFIDATAAWCITCQVNGRVAIHTKRTMEAFKENGVTLMIADWTRRNSEITHLLAQFNYQGVPMYVFYPPEGREPVLLPQILSEDYVINTIKGAP